MKSQKPTAARSRKKGPVAADKWPADEVVRMAVSALVPYARNARTHSPAQVAEIARSIETFGWTIPVLIAEDGTIIAGHGRVMAAQKLGIDEVPVMVARGWSDEQRRAYTLADNRLAETSEWDLDLLRIELSELRGLDIDATLTGFSDADIGKLLSASGVGRTDPDDTPEPEAVPVSVLGDIWQLGSHRIACGSSTDAATVAALLADEKPMLMVTDPPYGVNYDPSWREGADLGVGKRSKGKVLNDDRADWREAWALFEGDVAYVWHGGLHPSVVQASLAACGLIARAQVIWVKQHFVMSRGDYHWMHEPCWYAVRKGGKGHWAGDRKQTTVWEIADNNSFGNRDKEQTWGHGTQKPVECMRRPIVNNSQPGDAVYEPFSGSGTTIIAAEMTGRRCFAVELNPAYVDVAIRRWQDFTGKAAVLVSDGRSFEEVSEERLSSAA